MDTPGTDEADAFANGERGRSLYRFRLRRNGEYNALQAVSDSRRRAAQDANAP
jgi:hypothetical protein